MKDGNRNVTIILGALLIAAALVVAANITASRPMQGNISGSFVSSGGGNTVSDAMNIHELQGYLNQHADYKPDPVEMSGDGAPALAESYVDPDKEVREQMTEKIRSGVWPGFPYVELGGEMIFSKQAVDEWLYAQAQNRATLP